jgi:hypothetical protein
VSRRILAGLAAVVAAGALFLRVGGHTTNCQGVLQVWGVQQGYSQYIQNGCGGVS